MKKIENLPAFKKGYNQRLFEKKSARSFFHNARFKWFEGRLSSILPGRSSIFELGCFDGRLLDYLPNPPYKYLGYDADWEGGLSVAQARSYPSEISFVFSDNVEDLKGIADNSFDVAVAMETLEHLPPEAVGSYIREIKRITRRYFIVSVPNEKGIVFFIKHLTKKLAYGGVQQYTLREFIAACFGRLDRVVRDDHKGFDYDSLISEIEEEFEVECVEPVPFPFLPICLGFTVGIVAKKPD